jgi:hypothetical protein
MTDIAPPRYRLVLMSVGSLVGNGVLECIESLGRDRFEIVALNSEAAALNNFRADVAYLAPTSEDREAILGLLDTVLARHSPQLFIPGRDDDVVTLAHWKTRQPRATAMVGSVSMAEIIRDKWRSYEWCCANDLPFAASAIDREGANALVEQFGYPLVAKPRLGFGSNGVRFLVNQKHIDATLAGENYIVQAAIDPAPAMKPDALDAGLPLWFAPVQPGSPLGIALLDDNGARFVSTTESRHVRGSAIDNRVLDDAALRDVLMRMSRCAWRDGWRGLFSIQVRRDADGAWIPIEFAGRFMGATAPLQALGIPVVEEILATYIPEYERRCAVAPNYSVTVVKQIRTFLMHDRDVATLRREGVWRRDERECR